MFQLKELILETFMQLAGSLSIDIAPWKLQPQ